MKIKITRSVDLSLSADDWGLYGLPGRDRAADGLNLLVSQSINAALNRAEAREKCTQHLDQFRAFGAADSEGRAMLGQILSKMWPQVSQAIY